MPCASSARARSAFNRAKAKPNRIAKREKVDVIEVEFFSPKDVDAGDASEWRAQNPAYQQL